MAEPVTRRNRNRAVGETNQDAITRLAGERDAALRDVEKLRDRVAAGDDLHDVLTRIRREAGLSSYLGEIAIRACEAWEYHR